MASLSLVAADGLGGVVDQAERPGRQRRRLHALVVDGHDRISVGGSGSDLFRGSNWIAEVDLEVAGGASDRLGGIGGDQRVETQQPGGGNEVRGSIALASGNDDNRLHPPILVHSARQGWRVPYDCAMTAPDTPLVSIDQKALSMLLEVRDREVDAPHLGLVIGVSGVEGDRFTYEMALMRLEDAAAGDHVVTDGVLPVIVPAGDVENLRGATIQMSRDLLKPGLTIENPNSPSPLVNAAGPPPELTGTVAERVVTVVDQAINPAIASHGGFVEVVAVEDQDRVRSPRRRLPGLRHGLGDVVPGDRVHDHPDGP